MDKTWWLERDSLSKRIVLVTRINEKQTIKTGIPTDLLEILLPIAKQLGRFKDLPQSDSDYFPLDKSKGLPDYSPSTIHRLPSELTST